MGLSYAHITKNTNPNAYRGGYKNVFLFAPRRDFLSLSKPPDPGPLLGDALTVAAAHTFTDPKGFIEWECKTNSVTLKGATVGEDGAQEMEWTAEFNILGDSASTQEQIQRILNEDGICLLKEAACLEDDSYVQLGDECVSPVFKAEFDGKTTKEGKKEYKITVTCKVKYFYTGAVTKSEETEP
jgi:hypothetical protein